MSTPLKITNSTISILDSAPKSNSFAANSLEKSSDKSFSLVDSTDRTALARRFEELNGVKGYAQDKKHRVFAAQFASFEASANTPHSPRCFYKLFHIFFAVLRKDAVALHRFNTLECLHGHIPRFYGVL